MPAAAKTPTKPSAKPSTKRAAKKPALKVGAPAPTSDIFLGQIEAFAFNFAPPGWLPCDGRQLPISQNQALFSLLGTSYGGDGRLKFALPKLAPITAPGPSFFIAASPTIFPFPSRG